MKLFLQIKNAVAWFESWYSISYIGHNRMRIYRDKRKALFWALMAGGWLLFLSSAPIIFKWPKLSIWVFILVIPPLVSLIGLIFLTRRITQQKEFVEFNKLTEEFTIHLPLETGFEYFEYKKAYTPADKILLKERFSAEEGKWTEWDLLFYHDGQPFPLLNLKTDKEKNRFAKAMADFTGLELEVARLKPVPE